ncbi:MAG: SDR family NAD(P)-dependent oxidoreductase [Candidatus Aenigmarchaeota archaeon]|nr:SDR family NAD(P)-dependent oxidoreductase [Candidatus Aenigmarchaeota archaeon]
MLDDKKVLITGGAGTIGSALAREVLRRNAAVVRILDNDETKLFEMEQEFSDSRVRYLLGDMRDKERLYSAVRDIDIVFHAAALKHVRSSEYNPFEAVKTNVLGLQNLIEACIDEDAKKVIFTSSDKAANPTNVMGTTKLLGEKLITAANYYKGAHNVKFSSVRFGNVLGSRGSLLPLVKKQVSKGGPVTITDPEMTRFYMSEHQAIAMILDALEIMHGGEVFILKMPVFRVGDIVGVMMEELAGGNATTKTIGPRAGEKPYEELMTMEESRRAIELDEMFVILPEIKELLQQNGFAFDNSRKARIGEYASNKERASTKEELRLAIKELI